MISIHHLEQQTAGDAALQCELLGLFVAQVDEFQRWMWNVAAPGGAPPPGEFHTWVHRLRGAASAIGAFEVAAAAAAIDDVRDVVSSSSVKIAALQAGLDAARADAELLIAARDEPVSPRLGKAGKDAQSAARRGRKPW